MTDQKKSRIHFTIEIDLILLKEAISANPWQLGKDKWKILSENLLAKHNLQISGRTVKDRIDSLKKKLQYENLTTRTGTEEQSSERKTLLEEIISMENEVISNFTRAIDAKDDSTEERKKELQDAAEERNQVVEQKYGSDTPLGPSNFRRKRTAGAMFQQDCIREKIENDRAIEEKKLKLQHELKLKELEYEETRKLRDYEMDQKKLVLDNDYRMKALEIEEKRIQLEQENKQMMSAVLAALTKQVNQN